MNKKLSIIVVVLAISIGAFWGAKQFYLDKQIQEISAYSNEMIRPHSVRSGPDIAKVTLVEFLDPECESCRTFYPFVKQLLESYNNQIRLVIRYAPFHANSTFAIRIIEAARLQGKYWEALDLLFRYQPQWGDHHDPKPELIWNFLPQLDLDIEKLKIDMKSESISKIIEQDRADAQALGVRYTPTFFVNGQPLDKFGPEHLREAIQKQVDL